MFEINYTRKFRKDYKTISSREDQPEILSVVIWLLTDFRTLSIKY